MLAYYTRSSSHQPSAFSASNDGRATKAKIVNLTISYLWCLPLLLVVIAIMSIVEELRQNDPARKSIRIDLHYERSDADLAQALEQNPFVTDIVLNLHNVQQTDWNSFLRVIAMRANLGKVELRDTPGSPEDRTAPAALVRSILRAIQQNTAIRIVELTWLRLPTDISTFLDNASSITSFCLDTCNMDPAERQQGARDLAAALQRNTNIETLKLIRMEDIYIIPILEGLRSNTSVKTFMFSAATHFSDAASHALQRLLDSTTLIRRFELMGLPCHGDRFRPLARAITDSDSLSELKLYACAFTDGEAEAPFRSILQNKRNLTALCLQYCNFGGGRVHEDIISILSRQDSLLRCFEFHGSLERAFPGVQFRNLLQAIQRSKLERFQIGTISTPAPVADTDTRASHQ